MEKLSDVKKLAQMWGVSHQKALSVIGRFRKIEALNNRQIKIDSKRNILLRQAAIMLVAENCTNSWLQFQNAIKGF